MYGVYRLGMYLQVCEPINSRLGTWVKGEVHLNTLFNEAQFSDIASEIVKKTKTDVSRLKDGYEHRWYNSTPLDITDELMELTTK